MQTTESSRLAWGGACKRAQTNILMQADVRWSMTLLGGLLATLAAVAYADDRPSEPNYQRDDLVAAIGRAVPLLQHGAAGAAKERTCFTCHNQALPVMALKEARELDVEIDEQVFQAQIQHTLRHLQRGKSNYQKAKGQGGQVTTAGYALWTLEAGGHEPDEVTSAVVHYLLERQKDQVYWSHKGQRPPTSGSDFTNTYLAMRALQHFGQAEHQEAIRQRATAVGQWFAKARPKDNEDRVFRLRLIEYLEVDETHQKQAFDDLRNKQNSDGGWSQTDDMDSDAYATATALVALMRGGEPPASDVVRRGIQFLLDNQLEDGSWHVVTRAKGFQKYFESGFPHGKDQFVSAAATGWAVIALRLASER